MTLYNISLKKTAADRNQLRHTQQETTYDYKHLQDMKSVSIRDSSDCLSLYES